MSDADIHIPVQSVDEARTLLGPLDSNARLIRELHGVSVLARDGSLRLLGDAGHVQVVQAVLEESLALMRAGRHLGTQDVAGRLRATLGQDHGLEALANVERPVRNHTSHIVRARTAGQERYLDAMERFDVTFGVGPAGTGKTYLAVAKAIEHMKRNHVRRLVLVRPAVEAGEKLGFLPGDFQAKIDPYLRPMHDALQDLLDSRTRVRWLESDVIEVCPLAYMRGRTLNHAFVILDEAQNTTVPQMLMFLTRLGEGSRMVVTGDPSQTDLPANVPSGLGDALRKLDGTDGVGVVKLDAGDVVRHAVVSRIVTAYDRAAAAAAAAKKS
ncbi:MAG: PhoH family protein [Planctomycetes bacterium]|nr:PhoH family protein [Planctomycetota bacterium]MCC7399666.1 PhoH family protein [Planctomycetota bacterium]